MTTVVIACAGHRRGGAGATRSRSRSRRGAIRSRPERCDPGRDQAPSAGGCRLGPKVGNGRETFSRPDAARRRATRPR
ncbi:hypothetical protein [Lysobacter gummosus]|uniref:hypothetical protein n=1 Tax=Lysobacter gummosus TaxID=262324 RepID=UPI00363F8D33